MNHEPFIFQMGVTMEGCAPDSDRAVPTHKVQSVEEVTENYLTLDKFVVYSYPLARDYGQINGMYNRTAEPFKISLVGEDWEWRTAVTNYVQSDEYELAVNLHHFIRAPKLSANRYRLHFARFLLPTRFGYHDSYVSPYFFGYYIMKDGVRYYIDATDFDSAFYCEPDSWNSKGKRAMTIPEDWASNRFADAFGGRE